jgi:hypothetical protein
VDIVNGEVFVKKSRSHRGTFMLESHGFFDPEWWTDMFPEGQYSGFGPFVSVILADTEGGDPFSAYGIGLMVGFKDKDDDGGWNLGFGYYMNTEFQELRKGVSEGMRTIETNPENLLVERDRGGVMIILSSTW